MRFDHPTIQKVAKSHGKDQAQIFLRWGIQHVSHYQASSALTCEVRVLTGQGYIVIPKSVSQKRIVSNSEVFNFVLSEPEMREVISSRKRGVT